MRVGLVGCGRWGTHVLRDLRGLGCEVSVVARSPESGSRARSGGAREVLTSVEALREVSGVVVVTPTSTHADVVESVLGVGVPVFVEKPMCDDVADATRLASLAPGRLFVMDKWRYHPGVRFLRDVARSGRLGDVRGLRTIRVGWGRAHADVDSIWTLLPHDLSIALEILGAVPLPRDAVGHLSESGAVALHALLELDGVWHATSVSDSSPETTRRVELHCDSGIAILAGGWDEHVSLVAVSGTEVPVEERLAVKGELPLLAELRAFVEHLRGGPPPRSSAAEGLSIVAAISALRSMASLA